MVLKLCAFLLPLTLFSSEMIWSSDVSETISQTEYDKAIKEYVDKKYPERVKAWKEMQRQKEIITLDGLMWQDNEDAKTIQRDWTGAKEYCEDLTLGGLYDWRLPNIDELKSIVDEDRSPTIKKEFRNTASSVYWSSSRHVSDSEYAWYLYFYNGFQSSNSKAYNFYVRCVRAGQ